MSDSNEPVELLVLFDHGEAELVRRLLDSYGIPCQTVSQITHSLWPITVDGLGELRLLVPPNRLEDARQILAEHRRQGMEMLPGGPPAGEAEISDDPSAAASGEPVEGEKPE